jgi:hypothetical protein
VIPHHFQYLTIAFQSGRSAPNAYARIPSISMALMKQNPIRLSCMIAKNITVSIEFLIMPSGEGGHFI